MAYSPSPQPSPLEASGSTMQLNRLSTTPPLPLLVSKRDKKRLAALERLNDISASFALNRDAHYRTQLQSLQLDMNYINHADPYQNKPLEDTADEICAEITSSLIGNAHGGIRSGARATDFEAPPGLGKWSAIFPQEVNNAMEERDTQLTELANRHNEKIESLYEESHFCIKVAEEEHKALSKTIRERLIQSVNQRKNRMLKEKEHLDIADTNALLFNPSQFSITNPASPGGAQSNRKTRHTRHRLEVDDLGTIGDSNKRKRKAPADAENGSPGPSSRAIETDTTYPWEKSQARLEYQQMTAPLYSVDRLFTEKELTMHTQIAVQTSVHFWASKRTRTHHGNGRGTNGSDTLTNGDISDAEDAVEVSGNVTVMNEADVEDEDTTALAAPEMDRTVSQSFHATRSTRNNNNNHSILNAQNLPGELAGRISAIATIGANLKVIRSKDDANYPPSLTEAEKNHDVKEIADAIAEEDRRPGYMNKRLVDEVCHAKSDYWQNMDEGSVAVNNNTNSATTVPTTASNTLAAPAARHLTLGSVPMSAQPSMTGFSDIGGGVAMSRGGSAAGNGGSGSAMKRTASGPGYANANANGEGATKKSKLRLG